MTGMFDIRTTTDLPFERMETSWNGLLARDYSFEADFPQYERLWKLNIAPASPRPQGLTGFRVGADTAIRYLCQNSYSVLHNLVQCKRYVAIVSNQDFGFYSANIQCIILFAGNALQLLTEVQRTIERELGPVLTGANMTVFPDWNAAWAQRREGIVNYRNYLTHRGLLITVYRNIDGVQVPHVLSRNDLQAGRVNPTEWAYARDGIDVNGPDWVSFPSAAIDILNDTILFCNDVYERICDQLEPHHPTVQFQTAWGWGTGLPIIS